jgi:cytochrome c-type biogenesis protein CcmH
VMRRIRSQPSCLSQLLRVRVRTVHPLALVAALTLALAAPAAAQEAETDSSPGIAPAPAGGSAEPQTDLADIEDEVMCPICGTALGLSESPQADRQRAFIRELIAEGRTKDEIKDALVAEYGDEVLAVPQSEGFDLAAWIVPGLAILLAGVAIAVGLRRWRRTRGPEPVAAPSPEDKERLRKDLAGYEL